jgi:hypothetical protein
MAHAFVLASFGQEKDSARIKRDGHSYAQNLQRARIEDLDLVVQGRFALSAGVFRLLNLCRRAIVGGIFKASVTDFQSKFLLLSLRGIRQHF